MEKFVCAFRGRRDSYQVPLALAEGDLLEAFITDAYATPLAKIAGGLASESTRAKLQRRREPGIPEERVTCLWGTALLEQTTLFLGQPALLTLKRFDRCFSLAAAEMARRRRSHLFLYSPYAWEAFTARYAHAPRRVMFQYHPHPGMERHVIAEDHARYPGFGESFSEEQGSALPEALFRRESEAWRHADLIFCASRFTLRSLLEAGCDESRCRIVPYGIDVPSVPAEGPPEDGFHVVFVGSGGQRKGLHHLLMAWRNAALPPHSKLTLVCRVIDERIEALAANTPRVEVRRGVAADELPGLYARNHLFAMPSLVEGFGQVYLEALAQGCPVLGTTHTALPDLGTETDGVFLTPVSDVDALTARLEQLARTLPGDRTIRLAARATAARFSWPAFRAELRRSLQAEVRPVILSDRIELKSQEPRKRVAISAIVTAYERPDMVVRTVRCLQESQPAPSEILVHVDGNQKALVEQLREAFPDITVLASNERLGPGGARNLLLRSAKEELVASFDDDSRPVDPDYFQRAIAAAQMFPDAAVLTATLLDGSEDALPASERPTHVATFAGGACIYRKSKFLQTTGYVPLPLAYGMEEVDLSLRLHATGGRVVHVPDLRVVHEAPLKNVRRIVFRGFWPRLVTAQDPGHRDTREIAAGTVANLALLPFLRYPLVLWPYGAAQCLHKVLELMCNGRTREALAGLWNIPGHLWRHRRERAPLTVAQVRSYLRLRRHGSEVGSQKPDVKSQMSES
jgi:glycosyltransferase involved in cell wall biosynthesis